MRFRLVLTVAALLVSAAAFAQQSNQISLYVTNPGFEHSSFGTHVSGGGALSLNHFWTPRFSTELVAGAEHYYARYSMFDPARHSNVVQERTYSSNPLDLLAQYHFRTDSRWKPYAGAGMRWAQRPSGINTGTELAAELNSGVLFTLTPRVGLTLDVRAALTKSETWNPSIKPSAGLSWRF